MAFSVQYVLVALLVAAVATSSFGVAMAHEGHVHAPAEAPSSGAVGLVPSSIVASLIASAAGFIAARYL
ncbi:hypothetical protein Mapa_012091 [Marchantia paleacea]|nr:hypothetical protein Mapa_012091 [Marchantia paleacea]